MRNRRESAINVWVAYRTDGIPGNRPEVDRLFQSMRLKLLKPLRKKEIGSIDFLKKKEVPLDIGQDNQLGQTRIFRGEWIASDELDFFR